MRGYLMVIRSFCSFLCGPRYGWAGLCHKLFGEYPAQVCFEYNLPVHVSENEAEPKRRAFSRDEVQRLFDYFDNRVDELYAANKKAWLTTLRDACIANVAYAYGVRRQELLCVVALTSRAAALLLAGDMLFRACLDVLQTQPECRAVVDDPDVFVAISRIGHGPFRR
jgi:hypothetical protein